MLHRIGISINDADFKELRALQKRLKLQSRSEVIRELVNRFRKSEREREALKRIAESYRRHPETPEEIQENDAILQELAKDWPPEDWS